MNRRVVRPCQSCRAHVGPPPQRSGGAAKRNQGEKRPSAGHGHLHGHLAERHHSLLTTYYLRLAKARSDLVLAMGTSLSGVMADKLVSVVGLRALGEQREASKKLEAITEDARAEDGEGVAGRREELGHAEVTPHTLGVVIINSQQTRLDALASLRIFARLDLVLQLLCTELDVSVPSSSPRRELPSSSDVWEGLRYGPDGWPLPDGDGVTLDLREGMQIVLTNGNPGLRDAGLVGSVGSKTKQGNYSINLSDGNRCYLGRWMLEAAAIGQLKRLPLVNLPRAPCEE